VDKITFIYNIYSVFKAAPLIIKTATMVVIFGAIAVSGYYTVMSQLNFYIRPRIVIRTLTTKNQIKVVLYSGNKVHLMSLAALISVTNKQAKPSTINSYTAQIKIRGKWKEMLPIFNTDSTKFYWLGDNNFTKAYGINFKEGFLKDKLNSKILNSGESLSGWIFFTLPEQYIEKTEKLGKIRLYIQNSIGEIQWVYLDPKSRGSELKFLGSSELQKGEEIDLSNYKVTQQPPYHRVSPPS